MEDIVKKLKILEEFAKFSVDDETFINVIDKLTEYKIQGFEKDLENIENDIKKFEDKYQLKSNEFIKKFESGEMGDDVDFFEWASLYDMQKRLKDRLYIAKGVE